MQSIRSYRRGNLELIEWLRCGRTHELVLGSPPLLSHVRELPSNQAQPSILQGAGNCLQYAGAVAPSKYPAGSAWRCTPNHRTLSLLLKTINEVI